MRKALVVYQADGSKDRLQRCTEQDADKANENVTPEDCLECPLRAHLVRDGSKLHQAAKKARDSRGGVLKPDTSGQGYVKCEHRQILTWKSTCSSCSKELTARICNGDKSPFFRTAVSSSQCAGCPFRTS